MHYFTADRTELGTHSEADIVELTVGNSPGYRVTLTGYAAVATFKRGKNGWNVLMSAPGHSPRTRFLTDLTHRKYVVMESGAALLAQYIKDEGVARRSGRVTPDIPVGSVRAERARLRAERPRSSDGWFGKLGKAIGDAIEDAFD